ncbi:uncharacterized protein METZ01_LOCUS289801, partial [marine metagenome]
GRQAQETRRGTLPPRPRAERDQRQPLGLRRRHRRHPGEV